MSDTSTMTGMVEIINIMIKGGNIKNGILDIDIDTSSGKINMKSLRDIFTHEETKELESLGFTKNSDNEFSSPFYKLTTTLLRSEMKQQENTDD